MKFIRYFTIALIAFITSPSVLAEEASPYWLSVLQVQVKPGMQPRYEQAVRRIVAAHDKLNTEDYWNANVEQYGTGGSYAFVARHDSLATLQADSRNVVVEAFGEEAAQTLAAEFAATIASATSGVWMWLPSATVASPGDLPPPKNMSLLRVWIKPLANPDYEQYLAKVAEATRAVAPTAYYSGFAPSWGADNMYVFAVPLPDLGELGAPQPGITDRLVQHFGKREADRLLADRSEWVERQEIVLSTPRPDLAHRAP